MEKEPRQQVLTQIKNNLVLINTLTSHCAQSATKSGTSQATT